MKKYMVTAAALMLGTSALAWAPAEKAHLAGMTASSGSTASATPLAFPAFDKAVMKSATASLQTSSTMVKDDDDLGMKSLAKWSDATVATASAESAPKVADDGGVTFAEADFKSKDDVGGIQTAAVEQPALTGMGGPIETATGYPACDPGPGDDRCIQLYEPGVHAALAAWKATDDDVAMGGPFEPAPAGTKETSSDHQGMDHGSAGHDMSAATPAKTPTDTDETPDTDAAPAKPATAATPAPGAIGGPVDARTGYPPCRPGRGDDRCIQLYERGVTGRDN